jgi:hypothetical protein
MCSVTGNAEAATIEWTARGLMQVAQLIFATYVADRQFDLAQQYSDRAQGIYDKQMELASSDNARWASSGAPCLDGFLSEVCGEPVVVPNYLEEAAKTMTTVRQQSGLAAKKVFECADVYCVGMTQHAVNEIAYKEAALATAAVHLAFRREEVDAERKNQLRLANKAQGISLSRNSYNGSSAGLGAIGAQYAAMAQKAGEGLSSSMQQIGASMQNLGNLALRNPFRSNNGDASSVMQERSTADVGQQGNGFSGNPYDGSFTNTTSIVGVNAMSAPGQAASATWGTNPMGGALGTSGSETAGSADGSGSNGGNSNGDNINGFW